MGLPAGPLRPGGGGVRFQLHATWLVQLGLPRWSGLPLKAGSRPLHPQPVLSVAHVTVRAQEVNRTSVPSFRGESAATRRDWAPLLQAIYSVF